MPVWLRGWRMMRKAAGALQPPEPRNYGRTWEAAAIVLSVCASTNLLSRRSGDWQSKKLPFAGCMSHEMAHRDGELL
jgi:hypothetical protein